MLTYLPTYLPTYLRTYSFIYLLHLLTHSLTHSLIYLLTYCTYLLTCRGSDNEALVPYRQSAEAGARLGDGEAEPHAPIVEPPHHQLRHA